jgi:hypothetical protein
MTTQETHTPHPVRTAPRADANLELDRLTLPYAGQTRMQLTVTSGMADARVRIDPEATDLIAIDWSDGPPPRLRASGAELRLSWFTTFEAWLRSMVSVQDRDIELVLHPEVEWTLHVRNGLSHFEADLASGKLARLDISGGVSDARIDLPRAATVVPIRIAGGASNLALRRPAETGVTLAVSGGISELRLDDQTFDAIGGSSRLVGGLVDGDAPRYAVEISGGASGLQIVPG